MRRMAAINHARTGAEKLWAGTVDIHPKEPVVVNLDIEPAERPEAVAWVDDIHGIG